MPDKPKRTTTSGKIADFAVREGKAVAERAIDRRLASAGYSKKDVRKIVERKGFGKRMVAAAIARLATRSVPGALLVGGGLIAKALFSGRKAEAEAPEAVDDTPEDVPQA